MAAVQLPLDLGKPTFPRARAFAGTREAARKVGVKRYFTGRPCARGHIAFRYTADGICQKCAELSVRRYKERNIFAELLPCARRRSRKFGHEFSITWADIKHGDSCPCCGVKFSIGKKGRRKKINPHAPSLDRLDPRKGYVPGNIAVICFRCNELKRDGTLSEIKRLAEWLEKVISDGKS